MDTIEQRLVEMANEGDEIAIEKLSTCCKCGARLDGMKQGFEMCWACKKQATQLDADVHQSSIVVGSLAPKENHMPVDFDKFHAFIKENNLPTDNIHPTKESIDAMLLASEHPTAEQHIAEMPTLDEYSIISRKEIDDIYKRSQEQVQTKEEKLADALAAIPGYKNQKVIPRDLCECNNAFKQDGTNWCVNCTLKPSSFPAHPLIERSNFRNELISFCLKRFDSEVSIARLQYFINKTMDQYDTAHGN